MEQEEEEEEWVKQREKFHHTVRAAGTYTFGFDNDRLEKDLDLRGKEKKACEKWSQDEGLIGVCGSTNAAFKMMRGLQQDDPSAPQPAFFLEVEEETQTQTLKPRVFLPQGDMMGAVHLVFLPIERYIYNAVTLHPRLDKEFLEFFLTFKDHYVEKLLDNPAFQKQCVDTTLQAWETPVRKGGASFRSPLFNEYLDEDTFVAEYEKRWNEVMSVIETQTKLSSSSSSKTFGIDTPEANRFFKLLDSFQDTFKEQGITMSSTELIQRGKKAVQDLVPMIKRRNAYVKKTNRQTLMSILNAATPSDFRFITKLAPKNPVGIFHAHLILLGSEKNKFSSASSLLLGKPRVVLGPLRQWVSVQSIASQPDWDDEKLQKRERKEKEIKKKKRRNLTQKEVAAFLDRHAIERAQRFEQDMKDRTKAGMFKLKRLVSAFGKAFSKKTNTNGTASTKTNGNTEEGKKEKKQASVLFLLTVPHYCHSGTVPDVDKKGDQGCDARTKEFADEIRLYVSQQLKEDKDSRYDFDFCTLVSKTWTRQQYDNNRDKPRTFWKTSTSEFQNSLQTIRETALRKKQKVVLLDIHGFPPTRTNKKTLLKEPHPLLAYTLQVKGAPKDRSQLLATELETEFSKMGKPGVTQWDQRGSEVNYIVRSHPAALGPAALLEINEGIDSLYFPALGQAVYNWLKRVSIEP